jgi:hypothetical protein
MTFTLISFAYNEEDLLPRFLNHYDWVDEFIIFYDIDSIDNTKEILLKNQKCNIINYKFVSGFNDDQKKDKLLEAYQLLKTDIAIIVDIDELILPKENIKEKLEDDLKQNDIILAKFVHLVDEDYGIFDGDWPTKVVVLKTGIKKLQLVAGNHTTSHNSTKISTNLYLGHFALVNYEFALRRRINRAQRISIDAFQKGYCSHWWKTNNKEGLDQQIDLIRNQAVNINQVFFQKEEV